jgi:2-polyprenyl-6-methoxyphenol hydroxylase-like FAD-dependent oxidoreductase
MNPHPLPGRADVVIVGAGPTGLALACGLTARGVTPLVLDRSVAGANTSRAAVVHARTLEALDRVDVADPLCRRGVVVPRFSIRDRGRALLSVQFDDLPTPYPFTLMVPQSTTERVLVERLRAQGGDVRWNHAVDAVSLDGPEATLCVTTPDGARQELLTRYVVGCDGMHSQVRRQSGIGWTGTAYSQSFVLADVHLDWSFPRDEVHLFFSPEGLVVVAPLPEDRYRIVATLDEAPEQPDVADVQSLLDSRGPTVRRATVESVVWSSRFRVHHRLASAYRQGPVFLAGDAAHVHSPAGGQGMNLGIQDALALADLMADVVTGVAEEEVLTGYESSRRPVAARVLASTRRLTRAATARHPLVRTGRNAALTIVGRVPSARRALALSLSGLSAAPSASHRTPRPRSRTSAAEEVGHRV